MQFNIIGVDFLQHFQLLVDVAANGLRPALMSATVVATVPTAKSTAHQLSSPPSLPTVEALSSSSHPTVEALERPVEFLGLRVTTGGVGPLPNQLTGSSEHKSNQVSVGRSLFVERDVLRCQPVVLGVFAMPEGQNHHTTSCPCPNHPGAKPQIHTCSC